MRLLVNDKKSPDQSDHRSSGHINCDRSRIGLARLSIERVTARPALVMIEQLWPQRPAPPGKFAFLRRRQPALWTTLPATGTRVIQRLGRNRLRVQNRF